MINLQLMMFALIIIGFFVKKIGMVGKTGQKNITNLVVDVILPCNIFESFLIEFSRDVMVDFAAIFIISLIIQIITVLMGTVLYPSTTEARRKCLRYGTLCSNAGFMGSPVAEGVFGSMGLTLASIYLIPQRIMMWSGGVAIFTGMPDKKALAKKVGTHPCIVSCFLGLLFMFTGWQLPGFAEEVIASVSDCNTALSMMVIGMILADADFRTLIDKDIIYFTVLRLIIIPILVWIPCRLANIDSLVTGVSVLLTAMPAGATTSILAVQYDGDAEFAVKLVVFSTAVSLLTTPVWNMLLT